MGRQYDCIVFLDKTNELKPLTKKHISKAGRNNSGRITSRHRGGGHKKKI